MAEILTVEMMRALEKAAIEGGAATGLELMERAGAGVAAAVLRDFPQARDVLVLCGPGNNGGDGYVVARLLQTAGRRVTVCALGDGARLPPDAAENLRRWRELGEVMDGDAMADPAIAGFVGRHDLVIDAILGTGGDRPLPSIWSRFLEAAMAAQVPIIAVDGLSGLSLESGRFRAQTAGPRPRAALTVSFEAAKTGHYLADGPACSGRIEVVPLDLSRQVGGRRMTTYALARLRPLGEGGNDTTEPAAERLAKTGGNKFGHGHAVILAGGAGRGGAARLAARAALRVGAGLVTVLCPPEALTENAARLDAVMLRPVADADALREVLDDARITAICAGPGLGLERARALLPALFEGPGRAVVLDADMLSAFADDPQTLFRAISGKDAVLTPHEGEFARLFPDLAQDFTAGGGKHKPTLAAAARAGATVLFKGPDTVIASGDDLRIADNSDAPWLATAGSGDVLAGIIAGLLARGWPGLDAASAAACLHAACARGFGPGLIAEDLPDLIPAVFRDLGL